MTESIVSPPDKGLILLVDDEPSILTTLSMLLEEEGYRVMRAEHGREALECLQEALPDLIITDYMMPYLTGAELINRVHAEPRWSGIAILLMSAALQPTDSLADTTYAFLSKPADLNELFEVVERLISESRLTRGE